MFIILSIEIDIEHMFTVGVLPFEYGHLFEVEYGASGEALRWSKVGNLLSAPSKLEGGGGNGTKLVC